MTPPEVGDVLGGFRLDAPLTEPHVFRASRGEVLATLEVLPGLAAAEALNERLRRWRKLPRHPNRAALLGGGVHDERTYLVWEHVEGESLRERVTAAPLGSLASVSLLEGLCAALADLHEDSLAHGGISPACVRLPASNDVVLTLAGRADVVALLPSPDAAGPPECLSPEQREGQAPDPRSDVWALGALLRFALSGQLTTPGENRTTADSLESPTIEGIDARLQGILTRCLARDPRLRFPNARLLSNALASWRLAAGESSAAKAALVADASLSRGTLATLALAVLLLVGALGALLGLGPGPTAPPDPHELAAALEDQLPPLLDLVARPRALPAPTDPKVLEVSSELGAPDQVRALALARARYRFERALGEDHVDQEALARMVALEDPARALHQARALLHEHKSIPGPLFERLEALRHDPALGACAALLLARAVQEENPDQAAPYVRQVPYPQRKFANQELAFWRALQRRDGEAIRRALLSDVNRLPLRRSLSKHRARAERLCALSPLPLVELERSLRLLGTLRSAAGAERARDPLVNTVLEAIVRHVVPAKGEARDLGGALALLEALATTRYWQERPHEHFVEVYAPGVSSFLDHFVMFALNLNGKVDKALEGTFYARLVLAATRLDMAVGRPHIFAKIPRQPNDEIADYVYLRAGLHLARTDERERQILLELRRLLLEGERCPSLGPINRAWALFVALPKPEQGRLRHSPELRAQLEEAKRLDPINPWIVNQVAMLELAAGNRARALELTRETLTHYRRLRFSERPTLWRRLIEHIFRDNIELLATLDDEAGARELLREALVILPNQKDQFLVRLARGQRQLAEFKKR